MRNGATRTLLAIILLVVVAVPFLHDRSSSASVLRTCSAAISADCLLDAGVHLLNEDYPEPIDTRPLNQLSVVGRIDDAQQLFMQLALDRGETPQAATEIASKSVSTHRLVAALQSGLDLDAEPHGTSIRFWLFPTFTIQKSVSGSSILVSKLSGPRSLTRRRSRVSP